MHPAAVPARRQRTRRQSSSVPIRRSLSGTGTENTQPHITGHQDTHWQELGWLVTLHFPPLSLLPDLYRHIQSNIISMHGSEKCRWRRFAMYLNSCSADMLCCVVCCDGDRLVTSLHSSDTISGSRVRSVRTLHSSRGNIIIVSNKFLTPI